MLRDSDSRRSIIDDRLGGESIMSLAALTSRSGARAQSSRVRRLVDRVTSVTLVRPEDSIYPTRNRHFMCLALSQDGGCVRACVRT